MEICRLSPAGSVPSTHGNGVVQAPVLLTNVSPAGVGSVTVTAVASSVPLLVVVREYTRFVPGVTLAGPTFVISTLIVNSGPTAVVAVAELLARWGSIAVLLTVAVFTMGSGPV